MAANNSAHHESVHHIVPAQTLTKVLVYLVALTVLTVVTAKFVHLGAFGVPVAFAIAIAKAMFVMAEFMALKYDSKGNRIIFATGFFFLAVLFFFCALDIFSRVLQVNTL